MRPQPRYKKGDKIGGRYQVHQALMGGMGEVYLCLDLETIQPFALKTFQQRFLTNPKLRAAFENEVATWVALEKHPNIVRCFYLKVLDDCLFMFLEWVAGDEAHQEDGSHQKADLRSWLNRRPLELRLALGFSLDICRGLRHAHQKQPGLVHRDLKPENILVAHGNVGKITDFGLAKVIQAADPVPSQTVSYENNLNKLQTLPALGGVVGTPPYMAPEQWRNEAIDTRTDIYALGCLIYEMLTGSWPYQATTPEGLCRQHLNATPPTLGGDAQCTALNPILARCLAKQLDERFASVDDLHQALSRLYEQCFAQPPRSISVIDEFTATDYYNRGLTYNQLQCYPEALTDFTQAIQLHPTDAEAYLSRGAIYTKLDRQEEAIADYTQAIQLDPTQVKAYVNRGSAYASLGQIESGLADLTQAVTITPTLAPTFFNRGNLYYRLGREAEAIADYTRAIKLDPDLVSAYANRANAYAAQGRYEEALADYNRAIQLDPSHERAYFNRGLVYATLQRDKEAQADFNQVIQSNPADFQAHYYLGMLYYDQGHLYQALPYLEQAAAGGITRASQLVTRLKRQLNVEEQ
jgi:serine/threonine protein kinase